MDELKNFVGGGMDSDSSPDSIDSMDFLSAFNIRLTGTTEGEGGYVTNIESTEAIAGTRPTGINKAIGAAGFETIRKALGFIYNSQGFHQIIELDYDTLVQTVIFTDKTDSGGISILPINPEYRICDIKLINDRFLVFTDGRMQICYIDYNKLKSGGYGTLTADDFSLMKAQPLKIATAVYANDLTRSVNLLQKKLFQFSYYNTYDGFEESTLSTYSKRPVPIYEGTPTEGTDVTKSNVLIVTVDIGNDRVKTLNISARYDQLDWFLIRSIDRTKVLSIVNTEIDLVNEIYEAYNSVNNTYSFAFYNDGLYSNLPVLFTDLGYDTVPHTAESLDVVNNNILILANVTEGYNRPVVDVTLSVGSYDPKIKNPPPDDSDDLRIRTFFNERISGSHRRLVTVAFFGNAKTGDQISITTGNLDGAIVNTTTYTVTFVQNNNTLAAIQSLASAMPYPTSVYTMGSDTILEYKTNSYEKMLYGTLNLANVGTSKSTSIHALKSNSAYQLALAHYDKYGRYMPISTDESYILKTQSYAQLKGATPALNWRINSLPPEGAASAQWLISSNNTHDTTLFITGKMDGTRSTDTYLVLNISPLLKFNTINDSSILNYSYSVGDRITFLSFVNDLGETTYFDSPCLDVEIVSFDIEVDTAPEPDETLYLLKVRKPASLALLLNKNMLFEIYSPKKRATTVGGQVSYAATVFYEIGEQILIENGAYSITEGTITDGDVYYKTRELADATDLNDSDSYVVEDFNFSDYYISNFYSFGRARTYFDTPERIQRKASIRYSDTFIIGSKNNGLTRFFGERIYGDGAGQSSSNYGGIYKVFMRDNYLICIQEFKVGHIPVNLSILEDQAEQSNVAISDKLLNNIRYASGKWGIGRSKETFAISKSGDIYFIDPNNSLPIRDGANGVQPIAGKMSKYFKRVIQEKYSQGKKMPCWFDNFNDEFAASIETEDDILQSIILTPSNWDLQNDYEVISSTLAVSGTPSNGTVNINTGTGKAIFTPTTGYFGNGGFAFSFTNNLSQNLTKNACILILEGDRTPNTFAFTDLINQPTSTLIESDDILITGINIPTIISVTGGEYRINSGSWTSSNGFTNNGDIIRVRQTSSSSELITTNTTLTVGSFSDVFSITTAEGSPDQADAIMVSIPSGTISTDNILAMIDTVGVPVSDLAYSGQNFVLPTDTAEEALILASDFDGQWVFVFNIKNILADFPLVNTFTFKIKGRAVISGTVGGSVVTYTSDPVVGMDGSPGTYMPSVAGGVIVNTTMFSEPIGNGADGTYNSTLPDIISFTYTRV